MLDALFLVPAAHLLCPALSAPYPKQMLQNFLQHFLPIFTLAFVTLLQ